MRDIVERTTSVVLTLAAVAFATVLVHGEFFGGPRMRTQPNGPPEYVPEWRDAVASGDRWGAANAPVTIVEFADLECPFCRQFNGTLKAIAQRYPTQVSMVFVHDPLSFHKFARPAARIAECARPSGKFLAAVDQIYAKQDSLGVKAWNSFGADLGVRDTTEFARCMSRPDTMPSIESGVRLAHRFNVTGTPTVLVNGWRYALPPSDTTLMKAIDDILAGRKPFKGYKFEKTT